MFPRELVNQLHDSVAPHLRILTGETQHTHAANGRPPLIGFRFSQPAALRLGSCARCDFEKGERSRIPLAEIDREAAKRL